MTDSGFGLPPKSLPWVNSTENLQLPIWKFMGVRENHCVENTSKFWDTVCKLPHSLAPAIGSIFQHLISPLPPPHPSSSTSSIHLSLFPEPMPRYRPSTSSTCLLLSHSPVSPTSAMPSPPLPAGLTLSLSLSLEHLSP